jgi:hypothetical protein
MKAVDRIFGCLLALGAVGHSLGSFHAYRDQPMTLLWALSASFAILMLAAINLLRTARPGDRVLAFISLAGCLVWAGFGVWFGRLLGNFFDFRPLVNVIVSLVLAAFSLRALLRVTA